jgi:uncharacterized membrane protein (UPF0127 family)
LPWFAFFFLRSLRFTVRFDTSWAVYSLPEVRESWVMAWLLREGQVLASLEIADGVLGARGLAGRSRTEGALLLRKTRAVHSFGMRFHLDVAWLDADDKVIAVATLRRYSFTLPRLKARSVVEAEAGAFERWGLAVGDQLEIKD